MSPKKNPEAGNLGAEDDDAGSDLDVPMVRQPDDGRRNLADDLALRLDQIEQQCRELGWWSA